MKNVQYPGIIKSEDDGTSAVWVPDLPCGLSGGDTRGEAPAYLATLVSAA